MMEHIDILFLGTGTSQGIPAIGCSCDSCTSTDPRNQRTRPSILVQTQGRNLLIDVSPDFRQQMLRHAVTRIDSILMTHHHFDHIGGFDDLRAYNFLQREALPLYATTRTITELRTTFRYAFGAVEQEGGGVPSVTTHGITAGVPFHAHGVHVIPVEVMHGVLPVLGFRIGDVAYVTDTNAIPEPALAQLGNLDVLVLDALRLRPHPTHFSLEEAVEMASRIGARRTLFTHIAHNIHHERDSVLLPDGMAFAHDGLRITSGTGGGS